MEIFNKSCPWLSMKNVLSHSCSISVISMFKFLLLVNSDMDGREKWKHKHKHDKIYGLIINVAAQMIFQMKCSLNGWQVIDGSVVCEENNKNLHIYVEQHWIYKYYNNGHNVAYRWNIDKIALFVVECGPVHSMPMIMIATNRWMVFMFNSMVQLFMLFLLSNGKPFQFAFYCFSYAAINIYITNIQYICIEILGNYMCNGHFDMLNKSNICHIQTCSRQCLRYSWFVSISSLYKFNEFIWTCLPMVGLCHRIELFRMELCERPDIRFSV